MVQCPAESLYNSAKALGPHNEIIPLFEQRSHVPAGRLQDEVPRFFSLRAHPSAYKEPRVKLRLARFEGARPTPTFVSKPILDTAASALEWDFEKARHRRQYLLRVHAPSCQRPLMRVFAYLLLTRVRQFARKSVFAAAAWGANCHAPNTI